jgi:hypothetical protein
MAKRPDGVSDYHGPAGGWGALKALASALKKEQSFLAAFPRY